MGSDRLTSTLHEHPLIPTKFWLFFLRSHIGDFGSGTVQSMSTVYTQSFHAPADPASRFTVGAYSNLRINSVAYTTRVSRIPLRK